MLLLFAVLGIVGVLIMSRSIALGLLVLLAAEGFFVVAYRRFRASASAAKAA